MQSLVIKSSNAADHPFSIGIDGGVFRFPQRLAEETSCFAIALMGRHRVLLTKEGALRWQGQRKIRFGSFEFSVSPEETLRHLSIFDDETTKGVRERNGARPYDLSTDDGRTFELADQPLIVGRHPSCDIRVDDPQVSQFHLALHLQNGAAELCDLGSRNGTRLNGNEIRVGRLSAGCISFGRSTLSLSARLSETS
ncbi:MAG: FHA domain-containing protein, partial [Myxococcota bacterium]